MTPATKEVPADSLIIDWTLYPRHHLDETNIRTIREAIESGEQLPPVIVDRKSKRVVDGVHRVTEASRRDGTVLAEFHTYKDDTALFLDSVRRNARHGVKLTGHDHVRVLTLADELSIDRDAVAGALSITVDKAAKLKATRTAIGAGNRPVPIKRPLRHLAGSKLSKKQERANQRSQGWPIWFHVDQIINAIEGDIVDWTDPRSTEAVEKLKAALSEVAVA